MAKRSAKRREQRTKLSPPNSSNDKSSVQDDALRIGTSGWTYDDWAERFYPPDVGGSERLRYYCQRFNSVEVNATFYRLPTPAMIRAWNERMPAGFHLVVKGSRVVTHLKRLSDCVEALERFFSRALELKRLEVVLWQLPPSLRFDASRLDEFLASLPQPPRHAVEFRHQSWWNDETAAVLARHRAAWVAVSHPRLPADVRATTDFLYLRFHGLGRQLYRWRYSREELAEWVERVKPLLPGRVLYAFFNNDYEANAPDNAAEFREMLAAATAS